MKRREFLAYVSSLAVAWPLVAQAQDRVRRVGVLQYLAERDPQSVARHAAFEQALQERGWPKGSVEIDYRWATDAERVRNCAMELVELKPDVILASSSISVAQLLRTTRVIPIVFAQVIDPVGAGFVDSLARQAATLPALPFSNIV